MFLSRDIDIKQWQRYNKAYFYQIWYKNLSFKLIIFSKYTTNQKTVITQRSLDRSRSTPLSFFLLIVRISTKIENIMFNESPKCSPNVNRKFSLFTFLSAERKSGNPSLKAVKSFCPPPWSDIYSRELYNITTVTIFIMILSDFLIHQNKVYKSVLRKQIWNTKLLCLHDPTTEGLLGRFQEFIQGGFLFLSRAEGAQHMLGPKTYWK